MSSTKTNPELLFRDFFDLSKIFREEPGQLPFCLLCERTVSPLSPHADRCPGALFEKTRAVWAYSGTDGNDDPIFHWGRDLGDFASKLGTEVPDILKVEFALEELPGMRDPVSGQTPMEWVTREVEARREESDRRWRAEMALRRAREEQKKKAEQARKAWAALHKLKPDLTPEAFERRRAELHTRFPEAEFNPGRKPPQWGR